MVGIRHTRQKAKLTAPGVCVWLSDPRNLPALMDRKQSTCMSGPGAGDVLNGLLGMNGVCRKYGQRSPAFPVKWGA